MTLFTWTLALIYPLLVILDLYYNWDRIGVEDKEDKPQPKPILEGAEIYTHPLLKMNNIKDPACDYELITEVEYYNDSRGERQYRTIHLLE